MTRDLRQPASKVYFCTADCGGDDAYHVMPDHWSNYREECDGHFNATIIGKAAYLAGRTPAEGPETHWGLTVTGIGEEKTSRAWYRTVTELLPSYPTMTQFRNAMVSSCGYYYTGSDYTNCVTSVEAVGLWTSDTMTGIDTDSVVSTAYFPAAGHERWRIFKVDGSNNLYSQYQYFVYGWPYWSTPAWLEAATSGPATAVFGGSLFVCFRGTSGTLRCKRMSSSGTWTSGPDPGNTLEGAPTLARWNGTLYVAYRKSNGTLYWRAWNGSSWSAETSTAKTSSYAPVLASSDEDPVPGGTSRLWLVWQEGTGVKYAYLYKNFFQNWVWSSAVAVGPSDQQSMTWATRRPAAAMFRGRLHVVGTNDVSIHATSCQMPCTGAADWTRIVEQDPSGMGDMHLEGHGTNDGRLYLWHRQSNPDPSPALYFRSKRSE